MRKPPERPAGTISKGKRFPVTPHSLGPVCGVWVDGPHELAAGTSVEIDGPLDPRRQNQAFPQIGYFGA